MKHTLHRGLWLPDTSGHACICAWNDGHRREQACRRITRIEPEACDSGRSAVLSVTGTTKQATFTSRQYEGRVRREKERDHRDHG